MIQKKKKKFETKLKEKRSKLVLQQKEQDNLQKKLTQFHRQQLYVHKIIEKSGFFEFSLLLNVIKAYPFTNEKRNTEKHIISCFN